MNRRDALKGCAAWASLSAVSWLSACQAAPSSVRVAINDWIGYAPLYLAQSQPEVGEQRLRLIEYPSNTSSMMALANREVEAAALTLDELLLAREGGLDARVAMVFNESHGADVVMAQPEVERLEGLRGRRIGLEATAVGALMFSRLMQSASLQPQDVTRVHLTADQHVRAYERGDVDVVITFEPMATSLRKQGAIPLLDSSLFPGLIVDVLAVRADVPVSAQQALMATVAGHLRAVQWLLDQPEQAAAQLAPHLGMTAQDVGQVMKGIRLIGHQENKDCLQGGQPRLLASASAVVEAMLQSRLLSRDAMLDGLCEPRYLPSGP